MKRTMLMIAALAALLSPARVYAADSVLVAGGAKPVGLAADPLALATHSLVLAAPGEFATLRAVVPSTEALSEFGAAPLTLNAVSYQPRSKYYRHDEPSLGNQTQIHSGFFDPEGDTGTGFVLGMRGGPMIDPRIQLGVGLDWEHRSAQQSQIVGTSNGPGGTVIITRRQLSSSSENTFPLLAYLQISGNSSMAIVPYGGFGGGYEWVTLSATDYPSGASFDATYGGWGWQAWGGAKIPLSGRASVLGEVYVNQSEPHRDVYDPFTAQTFRETVKLNGVGMRFGLSWGI